MYAELIEKLRATTGAHAPMVECPCCFESSGYLWEHGNDWDTGPWSVQTTTQCGQCNGTGFVEAEPLTLDDLEERCE